MKEFLLGYGEFLLAFVLAIAIIAFSVWLSCVIFFGLQDLWEWLHYKVADLFGYDTRHGKCGWWYTKKA